MGKGFRNLYILKHICIMYSNMETKKYHFIIGNSKSW